MEFVTVGDHTTLLYYDAEKMEWEQIDVGSTFDPRAGSGDPLEPAAWAGPRFALSFGRRWIYSSLLMREDGHGIALGDLSDPGFIVRLDGEPVDDRTHVVVPGHDGGWVVAWSRFIKDLRGDLRIAHIGPDGVVRHLRTLERAVVIQALDLVWTPTGHILVFSTVDEYPRMGELVALALAADGRPRDRMRIAAVSVDSLHIAVDADDVHIVHVDHGNMWQSALDWRGELRLVRAPSKVWGAGKTNLWVDAWIHHRGRFWAAARADNCHVHGCDGPALVVIQVLDHTGQASATFELDRGGYSIHPIALGRMGNAVIAAWQRRGKDEPVRFASLHCPERITSP